MKATTVVSLGLACCLSCRVSYAQATSSAPSTPLVFSVSADQRLDYPAAQFLAFPDEHQTFLPKRPAGYYVVAAMLNQVNGTRYGWTFLLQSDDLLHFSLVPGAGDHAHGNAIFWGPHSILNGPAGCNYSGVTHFDEQYAAPGSVLQDPTRPPGSMIMIYESEIHCPWSAGGGGVGWVSVGVAQSETRGGPHALPQVQWPKPVAAPGYEHNWLDYGNGRYAGLTIPGVPQTTGQFDRFNGDSLPSAFIDDVDPSGEKYIYVLYMFTGSPTSRTDGKVHIARAKLGAHDDARIPAKLEFRKWYNGGWNAPGIQTSLPEMRDDGVDPPGCDGVFSLAANPSVMYDEALGRYVLTYVCHHFECSTKPCRRTTLSWYYRTTTDLSTQQWSSPQIIANSTYAVTSTVDGNGNVHYAEDGLYPTFMTPGCAPGHIGLTGYAFLLNGDPLGKRVYARRRFEIRTGNTPVRKACGSDAPTEYVIRERR